MWYFVYVFNSLDMYWSIFMQNEVHAIETWSMTVVKLCHIKREDNFDKPCNRKVLVIEQRQKMVFRVSEKFVNAQNSLWYDFQKKSNQVAILAAVIAVANAIAVGYPAPIHGYRPAFPVPAVAKIAAPLADYDPNPQYSYSYAVAVRKLRFIIENIAVLNVNKFKTKLGCCYRW